MPMPATERYWIAADLEQFDDEVRRECLDGVLFVTPVLAWVHARVDEHLRRVLRPYCEAHGLGGPYGPAALTVGADHLEPDLVVFPHEAAVDAAWRDLPLPLLVIEITSPSTRRRDAGVKRAAYLRWGIAEYWQLDPSHRTLTVSRRGSDDLVATTTYEWRPIPAAPPCVLDLAAVFA